MEKYVPVSAAGATVVRTAGADSTCMSDVGLVDSAVSTLPFVCSEVDACGRTAGSAAGVGDMMLLLSGISALLPFG